MELNQYFLGLIVSMCAVHLASVASDHLRTLWNKRSQAQQGLRSESRERDDWYVFFHCADLLGNESPRTTADRPRQEHAASKREDSQQERQRSSRMRARL